MNTWIIIPAFNEEKYLGKVLDAVKKYHDKILVVNDGSTDKTADIVKEKNVELLSLKKNQGKGNATKKAINYAIKKHAEVIILMDADGQHKAKDIPKFIKKIKDNDIVFGIRKNQNKMPLTFRIGNFGLNMASRILYGINIPDTQSGFRAFKTNIYKKIIWKSNNYSMESEVISKVAKHKLKYDLVEIDTIYHDNNKGTTVIDGIKIFLDMVKWRLKS